MQEIKCPKCGEVFQVDEAGYAAIVKQVRDKEFNKELKEREAQFKIAKEDALEVAKTKAEKDLNQLIAQKDKEIADLQKKHDSESNETKLEIANLNAQIAAAESEKSTALEKAEAEKDRLISELNAKLQAKDDEQKHIVKEAEAEKDKIIAELQNQISNITKDHKHDMEQLKSAKQLEIDALSAQITNNETVKNLAVSEVETKYTKLLAEKKEEIAKLNGDLESKNKELEIRENSIRREYDVIIKNKDEQIEQYRDFKARQSTKMIGESLEQHCTKEFNKNRMGMFRNAYFSRFDFYSDDITLPLSSESYDFELGKLIKLPTKSCEFFSLEQDTISMAFSSFEPIITEGIKNAGLSEIEKLKLNCNWFTLFGISNNNEYLRLTLFGIKFTFKINKDIVNKLAWWK